MSQGITATSKCTHNHFIDPFCEHLKKSEKFFYLVSLLALSVLGIVTLGMGPLVLYGVYRVYKKGSSLFPSQSIPNQVNFLQKNVNSVPGAHDRTPHQVHLSKNENISNVAPPELKADEIGVSISSKECESEETAYPTGPQSPSLIYHTREEPISPRDSTITKHENNSLILESLQKIEESVESVTDRDVKILKAVIRRFSDRIMQETFDHNKDYCVAPLSMFIALVMVLPALTEESKQILLQRLGLLDWNEYKLHPTLAKIIKETRFKDDRKNKVVIQQAFAIIDRINCSEQLKTTLSSSLLYQAEILNGDITITETVRQWSREATDGQVDLQLNPEIEAAFINAINLDLRWTHPFRYRVELTLFNKRPFKLENGEQVKGSYVYMYDEQAGHAKALKYFENDLYEGVLKTYLSGHYQVFVLPKQAQVSTIAALDKSMDLDAWKNLPFVDQATLKKVEVYIPKTKMQLSLDNDAILEDLEFDSEHLSSPLGYLRATLGHEVVFSNSEKGTKAAAVSVCRAVATACAGSKPPEKRTVIVYFDRPYLSAVFTPDGELLFKQRVTGNKKSVFQGKNNQVT